MDLDAIIARHDPTGMLCDASTVKAIVADAMAWSPQPGGSPQTPPRQGRAVVRRTDLRAGAVPMVVAEKERTSPPQQPGPSMMFEHDLFAAATGVCKHCGTTRLYPAHDGAGRCQAANLQLYQRSVADVPLPSISPASSPPQPPKQPAAAPSPAPAPKAARAIKSAKKEP